MLNASHTLHVPDCFSLEVDSILCKKMRRGEISEDEAQEVRSALEIFPMQKHPFHLLRDAAFEHAGQTRTSPYDCLYLILAMALRGEMVTADRRFYETISRQQLSGHHLCWVEDLL